MPALPPLGHTNRLTYILRSRRFPTGVPVTIRRSVLGTECYVVVVANGATAYALRSELH